MITWHFDREKLTEREAQIVGALISVQWDVRTYPAPPHATREFLEKTAEMVATRMSRQFPDLAIRWEWREPSGSP